MHTTTRTESLSELIEASTAAVERVWLASAAHLTEIARAHLDRGEPVDSSAYAWLFKELQAMSTDRASSLLEVLGLPEPR